MKNNPKKTNRERKEEKRIEQQIENLELDLQSYTVDNWQHNIIVKSLSQNYFEKGIISR